MKLRCKYIIQCIIFILCTFNVYAQKSKKLKSKKIVPKHALKMQAVIHSYDSTQREQFTIESSESFHLIDNLHKNSITLTENKLTIQVTPSSFILNGKKVTTDTLIIHPLSGSFVYNNTNYSGSLKLIRNNTTVSVVYDPDSQIQEKKPKTSEPLIGPSDKCTVRVLLDERQDLRWKPWKLESKGGFILVNPDDLHARTYISGTCLEIYQTRDSKFIINNEYVFDQLLVLPHKDVILYNTKEYKGAFWLYTQDNSSFLINCVHIEDYVACVLTTESWPGWSLEVNKVFAIASRTYVIAMVKNALITKRPYHVKNTNVHQTYGGGKIKPVHRQAVNDTTGLFLTYNSQPIIAMFDACCGGIIPAKSRGTNFEAAPYLARSYSCTHCKDSKMYTWHARYSLHELEAILKNELGLKGKIKDIRIVKKDRAGLVQLMHVHSGSRTYAITGKRIYSLLKQRIKSYCFSVAKSGNTIFFKGRGRGHHMGLCQWGAKSMVGKGYDYKTVLDFYYPGTKLMKLI